MTDERETRAEFEIDLSGCARCHGDGHDKLTFRKLTHPVKSVDPPLAFWATCPTNGEPIMLAFVDELDSKVP